ncbi:hypothetical protein RHMOL_Rhmol06G0100100 [Rhododendron molle]|uniref:Uncharacterized protein n=1 Tax=Rhododendron molle TaxID=49168 RepID=A0ACC0NBA2_RHOML|nr:hypothetical protein RHMOL_Rhmol06G0100100 [Rhododendron molle]
MPIADPNLAALIAKIGKVEESVQETKRLGKGEIDMSKLYLFPNAKLSEKFKEVDFAKFDGTGDPKAHLQGYVGSLTMRGIEKEAMAQLFHESLSGPALQWFLTLEPSKKRTWEDIGTAFVAQLLWRRPYGTELWKKKESSSGSGSKSKRAYSGNNNVLFENTNQVGTSSTKPVEVNQISKKPKSQSRTFTQFSTPRSTILKKLTEIVVLKPLSPPQTIPPNLNQNVYCDFHQKPGHTTDNCIRLRHEIQNLIDNKVVDAPPLDKPNTVSNPLPQHSAPFCINQITLAKNQNLLEFDPTLFIVPDTESKPVVEVPPKKLPFVSCGNGKTHGEN